MANYESIAEAEADAGGGGHSSSWTERYSVDWSAEAAHDWNANASTFGVQGASWGGANMGNASQCEIVPGSGLQISPDAATASLWFNAQTCPTLYANVSNWAPANTGMFPTVGNLQAVCFQAIISGNVTQDDNGYGMVVGASSSYGTTAERIRSSSVWAAGSNSGYRISNSYSAPSWNALSSAEIATTYKLFEVVLFPGSLALASIRDETELVDPLGSSVFRKQVSVNAYNGNDETLNSWLPSNVWVQLVAYNGSLTTHTATFEKFRILTLGV